MSAYDWAGAFGKLNPAKKIKTPACGWCHPGGGAMEHPRKWDGTPDYSMNLVQAERRSIEPLDGDFYSHITPDKRSHFKESGVLEGDCFICHLQDYKFGPRNKQINMKNYRWAATVGAGLGKVKGAIFTFEDPAAKPGTKDYMTGTWNFSTRPTVTYNWNDRNKFTRQGKLRGSLVSKRVYTKSCLLCHKGPDTKKVGWLQSPKFDAHTKGGLNCTDCHNLVGKTEKERLEHNIAKGWHPLGSVRDDLDGTDMKTCAGCHLEGQYAPTRSDMPKEVKNPTKKHEEKFADVMFHIDMISCANCHSTRQPTMSGYILDMSAGKQVWYTSATVEAVTWAGDFGKPAPAPWKPWVTLYDARNGLGEQYIPVVPKVAQWFGEKMPNMEIRPIMLKYVRKAFGTLKNSSLVKVRDVNGKAAKRPTVGTDEHIKAMIFELTAMGFKNVVFVSDKVYELRDGRVVSYEDHFTAHPHNFPVHHNIVPIELEKTLGRKGTPDGCRDCHAENAEFFTKMLIRNAGRFLMQDYPIPREPNAEPQMYDWGFRKVPVPDELATKKE